VRVALLQGPAETPDPDAGLAAVADAAARAAVAGARLLVTPEMSLTGYAIGADRVAALAEPVPGPLTDRVAAIAAEHGLAIAVGLPVRTPAGVANTVVVVDSDGSLLAGYAKAHLYGDVDRDAFVPGDVGVVQFRLDGVVVGLLVCYDVEFPEAVRAHALAGTELLVVPTGLMDPYGPSAPSSCRPAPTRARCSSPTPTAPVPRGSSSTAAPAASSPPTAPSWPAPAGARSCSSPTSTPQSSPPPAG